VDRQPGLHRAASARGPRGQNWNHPDELRVDLDPGPGVEWADGAAGGARSEGAARRGGGLGGWRRRAGRAACTITCALSRDGASGGAAGRRWRSRARWSAARRRSPARNGGQEERHGLFLDSTRTPRTAPRARPIGEAAARRACFGAARSGARFRIASRPISRSSRCRARFARVGAPHARNG